MTETRRHTRNFTSGVCSCIDAFNGIMTLRYSTKRKKESARVRGIYPLQKMIARDKQDDGCITWNIWEKKERKKKMGANAYCMNRIFFFPEEMPNGSTIDIASQKTHTLSLLKLSMHTRLDAFEDNKRPIKPLL